MHVSAMHIPDGFINAPVSAFAWAIAIVGLAVCIWGARRQLDEKTAPLAGLIAVFVFAMQMLNFPVAAGTSGHLLGGALAAIADGGLSAMGLNIINMGLVTAVAGWLVFRLVVRLAGTSRPAVLTAAFLAGLISVPVSALAFVGEYAVGGTGTINLGTVLAAMTGVHVLIGIGEGIITALTVGAVYLARPDLVFGVHDRTRTTLQIRSAPTAGNADATASTPGNQEG